MAEKEVKFDRSQFKGAKLSTLKETKEQADEKNVRLLGGGQSSRPNFLDVNEGRNVFRIMPPHSQEDSAYQPCRTATLECELPEMKDGKEYTVTLDGTTVNFVATDNKVASINVNNLTIPAKTETEIKLVAKDANGVILKELPSQ